MHIYRLVTATPVEQEIVDRATYKLAIDAKVIQAGMFNDNSREHDRQQMLVIFPYFGDAFGAYIVFEISVLLTK